MKKSKSEITAIILAAGKGTRMKSVKAKILHELFFAPMIDHVIDAVLPLSLDDIIVITGHQELEVKDNLARYPVKFARQDQQLGTGDAVLAAKELLKNYSGTILIMCGDTPLIRSETLAGMIDFHLTESAKLTVMTTMLEDPTNYGRIVSDEQGLLIKIIEEKDATELERKIGEVNAGIYCVDSSLLFEALAKVGSDNKQGEVYLTDIVSVAVKSGYRVRKYICGESEETIGVNSRVELANAVKVLQRRRNVALMISGVSIIDPETTFIDCKATIGRDTIIHPGVFIEGDSVVGEHCIVNPFVRLFDCKISPGTTIESFTELSGKRVE